MFLNQREQLTSAGACEIAWRDSLSSNSDIATYVNNRRNGWTHDNDGRFQSNPASSTDDAHTVNYDAAGRMIQNNASGPFSNINYSAGYDGLDQLVFEQTSFNPNGPPISIPCAQQFWLARY